MNVSEPAASGEVTRLLADWRAGNQSALDQLTPIVYKELHRLAGSYLRRERPGHTLQPTALVNEAYMRLAGQDHQNWESRTQFFGVAAQLMRMILVDHVRRRLAGKRGGGAQQAVLEEAFFVSEEREPALLALDDALTDLAAFDARKAKIIELRYFGGLTTPEVAQSVGISTATVEREARSAQLWMARHMAGETPA